MDTVTRMFSESVLTATVLDRRRDLLAVHEPTLILDSTMMNENGRRAADLSHISKGVGRTKK